MKYRVIKLYPGHGGKIGDIIDNEKKIIYLNCKNWPEYFEEVKEKLFTTEDGVDIYKGDKCWAINKNGLDIPHFDCYNGISYGELIYFSTKEAAEKYIDENKPMYSKKQIKNT